MESLYGPLNDLRLAHLVELTEWVAGKGQGYQITGLGKEVLNDPMYLDQLRVGPPPVEDQPIPFTVTPPAANVYEQGEQARTAFFQMHAGPARVVLILIGLNIVFFLTSFLIAASGSGNAGSFLASGSPTVLGKMGALNAPDLVDGQWWRLVANCFLHFGLLHLLLNMTTLYLMRSVEGIWGSRAFLVLYLISGLAGSCLGIYVSPGSPEQVVYLAGASGAIWGTMCSELAWLMMNRTHLPPDQMRNRMRQISYALLLNIGVSMLPNISLAAHIGGGIMGFLVALLLQIHRQSQPAKRNIIAIQIALLPTILLLAMSTVVENDERFKPFKLAHQKLKEMPAVADYRKELEPRIVEPAKQLNELDRRAEDLYLLEARQRDPAEVQRLMSDLTAWQKKAQEAQPWLEQTETVSSASALKEAAIAYLKAMLTYAEALHQRATTQANEPVRDARKVWSAARLAWETEWRK